ncbi:MAG: OmpA family protein [Mangrovibacterium sp.]
MKKGLLLLAIVGLMITGGYAQESMPKDTTYNKWTIEGGVGFTKPHHHLSSGYRASTPDLFVGEVGARYMFNEFFGLKFGLGYNHFTDGDNSLDFKTKQYQANLQGVMNLGRVLRFEDWTRRLGLLAHAGAGVGLLNYETDADNDYVGQVLGGLTGQVKLSPRVSLNLDITGMYNIRQNYTFNGGMNSYDDNTPVVFNGTVGLAVALGKNKKHADWYLREETIFNDLKSQIASLESRLEETERGGSERDSRVNNISTRVEDLDRQVKAIPPPVEPDLNKLIAQLMNEGYVNIYFDFNSTKIDKQAAGSINALRTYLENNPDANVSLQGYADELGTEEYNKKLSQKRADTVAKVLVESGIDKARVTAEGKGEDISVDENSPNARRLARRVTFVVQ